MLKPLEACIFLGTHLNEKNINNFNKHLNASCYKYIKNKSLTYKDFQEKS